MASLPTRSDLELTALENARRIGDRLRRYRDDPRLKRQAASDGARLLEEAAAAVTGVERVLRSFADPESIDLSGHTPVP